MASTSRSRPTTGRTSLFLLAFAAMASAQSYTSVGCYSSATPLTNQGSARYQSWGYCQKKCVGLNQPVFALTQAQYCYCGSELPAASDKVSASECNVPCQGYPDNICGGDNVFSVLLTGTEENVPTYGGSSGESSSSDSSSTSSTTSTTSTADQTNAQPTVITSVAQGTTLVVTHNVPSASETASSSASKSNGGGGGGTSVAGIAAGVVVGVLAAIGIVVGVFFYLKRRRQGAAEEEYKRTQVSDFMRGGERKPPGSAYSQMSDSRLDPEAGARRNSHGSIADNQDYSRRILRVANPDDS